MALSSNEKPISIIKKNNIKICEKKRFCNIVVPSENTKILEFTPNQKFDEEPFILHKDFACLIE